MPIEEKNQPQDEDDGFPSFLRAPKNNESEDSNELLDLPEEAASELTLSETPQAAESEKLLEEEGEFDLDSMLEDVSGEPAHKGGIVCASLRRSGPYALLYLERWEPFLFSSGQSFISQASLFMAVLIGLLFRSVQSFYWAALSVW